MVNKSQCISKFSGAGIEYPDKKKLKEERVYHGSCFQRDRFHHDREGMEAARESMFMGAGSWLITFSFIHWKQKEKEQEVR